MSFMYYLLVKRLNERFLKLFPLPDGPETNGFKEWSNN